ncbi:ABC transporter ATP-binding protein [Aliiruegeria lutimaris]|uniref:Oligopeptide transport system ATP-binding protein n=1 Tax=Aliiruegeria lutimaris TaxID=571298 RepID=A0A1G9D7D4_9RHOB|nr:ABC transporter ATP-binding protein [Aliiruegeria lutimaris]SDK59761.1 oligopeptide transport system ATP-binding protein [Aliiruegeria lutimaris]
MNNRPVLRVENLTTRFHTGQGAVTAVDGVSFEVAPGETLGLVGESGSGKSVTAMSVLGLVPKPGRIVRGAIELNGSDMLTLRNEELRRRRGKECGMVFQNPMTALNPSFSVGWQMREAITAHDKRSDVDTRIHRALADVGMPDPQRQAASFPHQMSGGMRQRVVIAMGMINDPQLLIADEPTTALDVTIQAQVLSLMKTLTREHGTALLLITHNMGVVANMCDRVAVMYAGEIVEEAPVDELFASSRHPYTRGLLRSIPNPDRPRQKTPTLPGSPPNMAQLPTGCRFRPRCVFADSRCDAHPDLLAVADRHKARCWKTQNGELLTETKSLTETTDAN